MALCSGGVPKNDTNVDSSTDEIEVRQLNKEEWIATNGETKVLGTSKPQVLRNFATKLEQ